MKVRWGVVSVVVGCLVTSLTAAMPLSALAQHSGGYGPAILPLPGPGGGHNGPGGHGTHRPGGNGSGNNAAMARAMRVAMMQQAMRDLQTRIAAAQRALPIARQQAQQAQADLSTIEGELAGMKGALESSKFDIDSATKELRDLEDDLAADEQQSPLASAKAEESRAREAYQRAVNKVLQSATYKRDLARARASANAAKSIPEVRREALEGSDEVRSALHELEVAKQQVERMAAQFVRTDPGWTSTREQLSDAKRSRQELSARVTALMLKKASATDRLKSANSTIAQASELVEKGPEALARLRSNISNMNRINRGGNNNRWRNNRNRNRNNNRRR